MRPFLNRAVWVVLHRWAGLVIAVFLIVAGLTGSVLAFYEPLNAILTPSLFVAPPSVADPIDPVVLRERMQALHPDVWVHSVPLDTQPGRTIRFSVEPPDGKHEFLADSEFFLDPHTGALVGQRKWGDITQGWKNLLPFIYQLHYKLALGAVGLYAFGIAALIWTLDCFAGAYLTLPRRRERLLDAAYRAPGWWARWRLAWLVRLRSGAYKLNFDLHRAGGLWLWGLLLVMAWSSVAMNLHDEVYAPVTRALLGYEQPDQSLPKSSSLQAEPGLSWSEALRVGRERMQAELAARGLALDAETRLDYDAAKAIFAYQVRARSDVAERYGETQVWFDANDGRQLAFHTHAGSPAGNVVTDWLYALHMAALWGTPYRIVVCVLGLVITMLSVTGVYLWLKKRRARRHPRSRTVVSPRRTPRQLSTHSKEAR